MSNTPNPLGSMKGSSRVSLTASATLSLRAYFSSYHFWAASHFARLADDMETQHAGRSAFKIRHRAYVISTIIESVAFLEGLINELFQDAADNHAGHLAALSPATRAGLAAYWAECGKSPLLAKYQAALIIAGQQPLDRGQQPFVDAKLLIGLRNKLVHYRPETVTTAEEHDLEKKLKNKFPMNKLMKGAGNRGFDQILGAGCAKWAAHTADALAGEAFKCLGLSLLHRISKWDESP
jgi:hypothetical protein